MDGLGSESENIQVSFGRIGKINNCKRFKGFDCHRLGQGIESSVFRSLLSNRRVQHGRTKVSLASPLKSIFFFLFGYPTLVCFQENSVKSSRSGKFGDSEKHALHGDERRSRNRTDKNRQRITEG